MNLIYRYNQVLLAFFNTYQIDHCFSCNLHFHSHQCHIRQCFIYKLVTSLKFAFWSFQNSKCKYSPMMPSEFQFKEPPLSLGIPVHRTAPCPRNSKKPSIVVHGYFLELPICEKKNMSVTIIRTAAVLKDVLILLALFWCQINPSWLKVKFDCKEVRYAYIFAMG